MPTQAQVLLWDANAALLALAIVGLVVRGRARLSWAFFAYLAACFVTNRAIAWWPRIYWNYAFYDLKESAYTLLKVAAAWEVGLLTFERFPRARRNALLLLSIVTAAAAGAHWLAPASRGGLDLVAVVCGFVAPAGAAGTLWLFLVVILVALRYNVPLHPFHRVVVVGFALYLSVSGGLRALLRVLEPSALYPFVAAADPLLYAATVSVWTLAAWRGRASALAPALSRQLGPWAVR